MAIDVKHVLHMKEGTGETSYAKTSYIQKQVLLLTRSIKEEAIREFYNKQHEGIATLCIADLGCSSAELNNLSIITEFMETVEAARRRLGHGPQDYQIYLNDLPGNDFNTVFRSLPSFEEKVRKEMGEGFGHCFVNAAPGSFYGRLFPSNSLHFVHSSYSLMWLSKVPEGIEENKGNIYVGRTSPSHVVKAYSQQFEKDFSRFLQCRSFEVVSQGRMALTILGRKSNQVYNKESCYMWELLADVLNEMVTEGLIEEEKLNTFNIPQYTPSAAEIGCLVDKEGSFTLDQIHVSEVNWEGNHNNNNNNNNNDKLKRSDYQVFNWYDFAQCMRSVAEPLLISHFGEQIIDEVFQRYREIICETMIKEKNVFINVTVVMTRK